MKYSYNQLPRCPFCHYEWVPRSPVVERCTKCRKTFPDPVEWVDFGKHKCCVCGEIKPRTDEFFYRLKRGSFRSDCKECNLKKVHTHTKKKNEYARKYAREWRAAYVAEHGEDGYAAYQRDNAMYRRSKLKAGMLDAYGHQCACCGEDHEEFLTLDHIGGGGRKHYRQSNGNIYQDLKNRGWPKEGFRVLCMNCNFATRFTNKCPHDVERITLNLPANPSPPTV